MKIKWPKEPWMRAGVILWGLLCVAYLVKVRNEGGYHNVYPIFEAASHRWWQGLGLYDYHSDLDLFRYPPTFAVFLTPFAAFPMVVGTVVWNFFSIALLVWALHTLVRQILPGTWDVRREGMFLVLAVAGSIRGIWAAQSNAMLLALAIFAAAAALRERWWLSASLLAAATFIKLWPMALFMLMASYWPRQLIGRYLVACTGFGLVPFLTAPTSYVLARYQEYGESLIRTSKMRWRGNRDIQTIFEEFGPVEPHGLIWLQLTTAVGVLAFCWWQRQRDPSSQRLIALTLAAWAAWQLLFGPGTERLTYGLIAPFTSWAILTSPRGSLAYRLAWASWWLTAILGAGEAERQLLPYFAAAKSIQPFGVVVFWVWLLVYGASSASLESKDSAAGSRPEAAGNSA